MRFSQEFGSAPVISATPEFTEFILRHCGLWEEEAARAPPPVRETVIV